MIARGIVEKILDNKEILVRVPLLNKSANAPGATPTKELNPAVICNMPNCSISVKVGDIVFIGFENNDYSKPIILGYLFSDSGNASQLNIEADTLTVNSKVKLPADTSIGKVTSADIYNLFQSSDNLQQQIDYLKEHYIKRYYHYITLRCPSYWEGAVTFLLVNDIEESYSNSTPDGFSRLFDFISSLDSKVIPVSGILKNLEDDSKTYISYGLTIETDSPPYTLTILAYYQTLVKSAADNTYSINTVQYNLYPTEDHAWEISDTVL